MLAAIYCRLSVEDPHLDPGQSSESICNQQLLLLEYARNHGWEIFSVYVDEDYSGLDAERPAWKQLLEDASLGRFQIILCKSQSRFTRDMATAETYLHGLFPLWNIRFIGVVDGVDTALQCNKKARQINSLMNEWYCEDLSDNIRAILRRKMAAGQFIGSFACYGYCKSSTDRHALEIDPPAAAVVETIFRLYLQGFGLGTICRYLQHNQIPPPSIYKKQQGLSYCPRSLPACCQWNISTLKRMLHNETYTGTLVQGCSRKLSYKSKKMIPAPPEQWIRVPAHHAAIISKAQFSEVQKRLQARRKRSF